MLRIHGVLGHRDDPRPGEAPPGRDHAGGVDVLRPDAGDRGRRRLRATIDGGADRTVPLDAGQAPGDGPAPLPDSRRAAALRAGPPETLRPKTREPAAALRRGLGLGRRGGPPRRRARFRGDARAAALDGLRAEAAARLEALRDRGAVTARDP